MVLERNLSPLKDGEVVQAIFSEQLISTNKFKGPRMDWFKPIKVIGKGGFSRVIMVRKKDTAKIYAMKILNKQFLISNEKVL